MSSRTIVAAAAALVLGVASLSTDALAFRGGARGGAYHGGRGVYHGGGYAYRRGYVRPGVGVGAAAAGAAVGAAAAGSYYNRAACGYYPNPPCY